MNITNILALSINSHISAKSANIITQTSWHLEIVSRPPTAQNIHNKFVQRQNVV